MTFVPDSPKVCGTCGYVWSVDTDIAGRCPRCVESVKVHRDAMTATLTNEPTKFQAKCGICGHEWSTFIMPTECDVCAKSRSAPITVKDILDDVHDTADEYRVPTDELQSGVRKLTEIINNESADPNHYKTGDIECIDAIRSALGENGGADYCRGTMIKYLWRLGKKDEASMEAAKAKVYARWLADVLSGRPLTKGE